MTLCLIPHSGHIRCTSYILDFATRLRWVISFKLQPFYYHHSLYRRLGETKGWSRHGSLEKNSYPCQESNSAHTYNLQAITLMIGLTWFTSLSKWHILIMTQASNYSDFVVDFKTVLQLVIVSNFQYSLIQTNLPSEYKLLRWITGPVRDK